MSNFAKFLKAGGVSRIIGLVVSLFSLVLLVFDKPSQAAIKKARKDVVTTGNAWFAAMDSRSAIQQLAILAPGEVKQAELDRADVLCAAARQTERSAVMELRRVQSGRSPFWTGWALIGIGLVFAKPAVKITKHLWQRYSAKYFAPSLIICGAMIAAYFFFIFGTASGGVHNLGLLQDRMLGFIGAVALVLIGVLLLRRQNR